MKAKESITASVALLALAAAWFARYQQEAVNRAQKFDEKCEKHALDTFEGEGGLVAA
jgi:hypothetical protein